MSLYIKYLCIIKRINTNKALKIENGEAYI